MTQTETQLVAVYGPAIPLEEVCKPYFGLELKQAREAAALNKLPVPTFRMRESTKAPLLIKADVMAEWIDRTSEAAHEEWLKSQN